MAAQASEQTTGRLNKGSRGSQNSSGEPHLPILQGKKSLNFSFCSNNSEYKLDSANIEKIIAQHEHFSQTQYPLR